MFLNPLRSVLDGPLDRAPLTRDELKVMFSNIEAIVALNERFLNALQSDHSSTLGAKFLQMVRPGVRFVLLVSCDLLLVSVVVLVAWQCAHRMQTPFLKMYTQFCKNYDDAIELYTAMQEKPQFRSVKNSWDFVVEE